MFVGFWCLLGRLLLFGCLFGFCVCFLGGFVVCLNWCFVVLEILIVLLYACGCFKRVGFGVVLVDGGLGLVVVWVCLFWLWLFV